METLRIMLLSKGAAVANGVKQAYRGGYLVDVLIVAAISAGIAAVVAGILFFILYVGNDSQKHGEEDKDKYARLFKICFIVSVIIVGLFYMVLFAE